MKNNRFYREDEEHTTLVKKIIKWTFPSLRIDGKYYN